MTKKNVIEQDMAGLPEAAKVQLKAKADAAGMTVKEFVQYVAHVSIYRNAEEVLNLTQEAA